MSPGIITAVPDVGGPRAKTEDKQDFFNKANRADTSILTDTGVADLKASDDRTALHWLAIRKVVDVLGKAEAFTVGDGEIETAAHLLADQGMVEVLQYPDLEKVRGYGGWTPLRRLADSIDKKDVDVFVEYLKVNGDKEGNMDVLKKRGLV